VAAAKARHTALGFGSGQPIRVALSISGSTSPRLAAVLAQTTPTANAAGRTGAHEQTVRGWIKTGELKAARFGTRIGYRIKSSNYDDFLRRRTLTGVIAAQLLHSASAAPDS
jgi:excisionase family DNA binding protein